MKLLLLCLGLTLVCAYKGGEMDVVKNFKPSKITGKWFTILVASDQKEMIAENGKMRLFLENIDLLKNSSLLFKFHFMVNGQCTEIVSVGNKTDEDGIYTTLCNGHSLFSIADVNYNEYLIILLKNEKNFQVILLYGRKPDVRTEIKDNFVDFCAKHGISEENIVDMTKVEDRCLQARSDGEA